MNGKLPFGIAPFTGMCGVVLGVMIVLSVITEVFTHG